MADLPETIDFTGGKGEEASAKEAPEAEAAAEESEAKSPLFDEEESEEDTSELFEDEEEDEAEEPEEKPAAKGKSRAEQRIKKLARERKEARRRAEEATSDAEKLRQALKDLTNGRKPDLVKFDISFMDHLDKLYSGGDPAIRKAVEMVKARMEGRTVETPAEEARASDAQERKSDLGEKALAKLASREVDEMLEEAGVKRFRPAIRRYVLDKIDKADVQPEAVLKAARTYIRENGLTKSDVMGEGEPPKKRPPSGRKQAQAGIGPRKESEKAGEEREAPKSIDEWEKNRDARRRALFNS